MTPEQALDLLDRAAGLVSLPRQDHIAVAQAVEVIRRALAPRPKEECPPCAPAWTTG